MGLLDAIKERVLIGDGAMGTQLQYAGLEPGGCGEAWMQEHARNSCPQCRGTIAIYVRAKSGV